MKKLVDLLVDLYGPHKGVRTGSVVSSRQRCLAGSVLTCTKWKVVIKTEGRGLEGRGNEACLIHAYCSKTDRINRLLVFFPARVGLEDHQRNYDLGSATMAMHWQVPL